MGGKSSSQTIGYQYYASLMRHIGGRIDAILGINFDKRKWIMNDSQEPTITINEPALFGEVEGGVKGEIDIYLGTKEQLPNLHYLDYDALASGYPYKSYLIFKDFYHGNTNTMKECLLWVKRTRVQPDDTPQWYPIRESDEAVVCEIDAYRTDPIVDAEPEEVTITYARQSMFRGESQPNFSSSTDIVLNYNTEQTVFSFTHSPGSGGSGEDRKETSAKHTISVSDNSATFKYRVVTIGDDGASFNVGNAMLISEIEEIPVTTRVYIGEFRGSVEVSGKTTGDTATGSASLIIGFTAYNPIKKEEPEFDSPGLDINPIHKIREILTNPYPYGMGKPEIDVNDENFRKAADRIYDEKLGISWAVTDKDCIEAINELCYHIEGGARINRQTGKYEIVLFRNDWFDEDEIHEISEDKIKSIKPESKSIEDISNQINVTFYDRDTIKEGAFSIADVGLVREMNGIINSDVKFPYFQNFKTAEKVAQWKLQQLSTPTWSGSFTTGWREARKWNRYDLLWLEWSRKWSSPILVRIMSINLGTATNSTVTIEFEEVVQHSGIGGFIKYDRADNTEALPPQPNNNTAFEAPYYLLVMAMGQRVVDEELAYNSDYGIVGAIAESPQNNSLYAIMQTNSGDVWNERASSVDYVERAKLLDNINKIDSTFAVTKLPSSVGELALLGNEYVVVESIDELNSEIEVKRGALDTIPSQHSTNDEIFYSGTYFSFDAMEYQNGEIVDVKVLTTTPSGIESSENYKTVELDSRAIRPYPPANVKINTQYYPIEIQEDSDILVSWADRNRTQQTSGEPLGWYEPSVTIESGVAYSIELIANSVVLVSQAGIVDDNYTIASSLLLSNENHTLRLWSVRSGYASYQIFEHTFLVSGETIELTASMTSAGVSGETAPLANITANVDESLKANMWFDGTSIRGKAQPNAIITIEVDE